MSRTILASASPRRSELLKQIGLTFEVFPSDVEEKVDNNLSPEEIAKSLAVVKAEYIAKKVGEDRLIIGADTIVVHNNNVLGKPKDRQDAYKMLKSLEGSWHEVITGVAVVDSGNMSSDSVYEKTRVKMRPLTDEMIYSYIETGEPEDKAGAYGIQGIGAVLVEKIEGCYFNVVGLPLMRLNSILAKFGAGVLVNQLDT